MGGGVVEGMGGDEREGQLRHHLHRSLIYFLCHFLWDHLAHCGIFENGVLLLHTLEGVSSVANFITAYEVSLKKKKKKKKKKNGLPFSNP